jgi:sugar-specific transcriptional regulator TrmB
MKATTITVRMVAIIICLVGVNPILITKIIPLPRVFINVPTSGGSVIVKFIFVVCLILFMDLSVLKDAGLTEGEIKVYLALLNLGSTTVGPIVVKSHVARSIVYQILTRLFEKGLVSFVVKGKTKYYQANQPRKILDFISERQKSLEENKGKVEKLMPMLVAKQKPSEFTDVRYFEGFRGFITAHERTYDKLAAGDEYFQMGITSEQPRYVQAYFQRDHLRRAKAGIIAKLLFSPKTNPSVLENRNKFKGCDARYMPIDLNTPAWFMGYKDVAVITIPTNVPLSIEITNREVAQSFRAYFEEFWKLSKPFKSTK